MHFFGDMGSFIMRTALFIMNDENLMNRIKIMVHDENAQLFFADTIDDAVSVMDEREIAVVFMPYGMDVLSGDEMLEIIFDHNPNVQIILLFHDEDLQQVIRSHNRFHICKLISHSNMKLEELVHKLDAAFDRYNMDDEIKEFEKDYRLKEDKYRTALQEITSLLNDRMSSYDKVRSFFVSILSLVLSDCVSEEEKEAVSAYVNAILQDYVSLFILQEADEALILKKLSEDNNDPKEHRFLQLPQDLSVLSGENKLRALFVIKCICGYFAFFYDRYRGKIETEETDTGITMDLIFESIAKPAYAAIAPKLLPLNESLVKSMSDRSAFGAKERVLQYKMIYIRH